MKPHEWELKLLAQVRVKGYLSCFETLKLAMGNYYSFPEEKQDFIVTTHLASNTSHGSHGTYT
jgi:hypothetical protein